MLTIEERVAKGAAHLDKIMPGWRDKINPVTLDMGRGNICVHGQLFGPEMSGPAVCRNLQLSNHIDLIKHGFDESPFGKTNFSELTKAWLKTIDTSGEVC